MKYASKEGLTQQTEFTAISKCIRFKWLPDRQSSNGTIKIPDDRNPKMQNPFPLKKHWKRRSCRIVRRNAIPSPMTGRAISEPTTTASPESIPFERGKPPVYAGGFSLSQCNRFFQHLISRYPSSLDISYSSSTPRLES